MDDCAIFYIFFYRIIMFRKVLLPVLLLPVLFISCDKTEKEVAPSFSIVGEYDFQKVEINVDGNKLEVPNTVETRSSKFNADGSFSVPDGLEFFDGKYKYDDAKKQIVFGEPEISNYQFNSTCKVTSEGTEVKLETMGLSLDDIQNASTITPESFLLMFALLKLDTDNAAYREWEAKIGDNPKKFSLVYSFKKK